MSAIPKEISPGTGATNRLAEHVATTRYEDLGARTLHAFERAFQDHLTCAIAGSAMPVSRAMLDYLRETDTTRISTVIGNDIRLSPRNAAPVNGANTHGLDFDDGHTNGSAHPSGVIFPAVPESLERPQVRRLIDASDAQLDPECERIYPGRRSGFVRIDGRTMDKCVLDPKGEGENPMIDEDLQRKFSVNCEAVIGADKGAKLLEVIWQFETQQDTRELLRLVRSA